MKIVITGAAGFAATHLIRKLKENVQNEVFAWAKDEAEAEQISLDREHIFVVDITKEQQVHDALETILPERIYHLAAQASVGLSWKIPAVTMEVNSVGTIHLLEGIRKFVPDAKVLLIGSAEQYGKVRTEELPIKEERELEAANPYSISKMTQEMTAQMYGQCFGIRIVMVRAFNHIGPGQAKNFVIPDWCFQVAEVEKGRQEPVLRVGNIQVKRDFTDVRDIVKAYMLLMEQGEPGEVYNVGSGISYSLEEILQRILAESHATDIRYEIDKEKLRPADVEELRADITKLTKQTDWKPDYTLEQSIKDILEQMRREI